MDKPSSVIISGEAHKHYASMFRLWSGWDEAGILFDDPMPFSPWAYTDHDTQTVVLDPDNLILNPNRLLLTMTPYRMKQEAVLTGTVLHEAGHARFSKWIPRSTDTSKAQTKKLTHSRAHKKQPITKQTFAFARLMEEPRIEGLMARDAMKIGAVGLAWTMRAAAAHLIPGTRLSDDPDQRVMDFITSWAYKAGRHLAVNNWIRSHALNNWVMDLTAATEQEIQEHLFGRQARGAQCTPMVDSQKIMSLMMDMLWCQDHDGPTMVDSAKTVLDLLYPPTDDDDADGDDPNAPSPGGGCTSQPGESDDESDEQGDGGGQGQDEADKPADQDDKQKMLDALEDAANEDSGQTEQEAEAEKQKDKGGDESKADPGLSGGKSNIDKITGKFRQPTPAEREIETGAQRFLRTMIDPTTSSKIALSSSPSSNIDAAAFAAWKASGQTGVPHFFKRTKRTTAAAPPVKIAVLVDVSSSMESLQAPSALLSWALASAAIDLRNFAGRGVQVESTLIHWGDVSQVIQKPGQLIPGIREVACDQGTSAMHLAFDQIEQEIPGFFEEKPADKPESRLIVQFTDWDLYGRCVSEMGPRMSKALASGVNHLSVFPNSYSMQRSDLNRIAAAAPVQRGKNIVMTYDPSRPGEIWDTATKALG